MKILRGRRKGGIINNINALMILKIILIQIQSQNKLFECFTLLEEILKQ